jgi:DNA-binding MarR family transcriptional regulator
MQNELKTAKRLLEIIPLSMARVRAEMRSCIPGDLSVPHFRILGSIMRGKTLVNEIAQHHGVSQPSMSRSVDSLVKRGLIERSHESEDRRQTPLRLTKKGAALFRKIKTATEKRLSREIIILDSKSSNALLQGLDELEKLFSMNTGLVAAPRKGRRI